MLQQSELQSDSFSNMKFPLCFCWEDVYCDVVAEGYLVVV